MSKFGKLGLAGAVAGGAVAAVNKIRELSAESNKTKAVFNNLEFAISGAAKASLGLVDNMTLAESQVRALQLGAISSEEEFRQLTEAGAKLGFVMQGDAAKGVDDLTTALARGSTAILDNLGITLTQGQAQAAYAEQLGKHVNALTDAEKAEAFRVIGLQKAVEASRDLEIATGDATFKIQQMEIAAQNLRTQALGGVVDSTVQLKTVVEALGDEILTMDIASYGADYKKLERASEALGLEVEDLGSKMEIQAAIMEGRTRLLQQQAKAAEDAAEAERRLGVQLQVAELKNMNEEQEFHIKLLQASGADQKTIALLRLEQLRIAQEQAMAESELNEEAAKRVYTISQEIQLQQARIAGIAGASKGGGRGKSPATLEAEAERAAIEAQRRELEQMAKMLEAVGEDATRAKLALLDFNVATSTGAEQDAAIHERRMFMIEEQMALEARGDEARKAAREEWWEMEEEDRKRREEAAKRNEAALAKRIAEEKAEVERLEKTFEAYTRTSVSAFAAATEAAVQAKDSKGAAFAAELGEFAGSRAKMLGIEAATHFALAAIWAAALNPVKATAELTAGGIAAAKASALGATAAALGAMGGASVTGIPGASGGGFTPSTAGMNQRPGATNGAPVSPLEQNGQPVPAANDAGGKVVNIHVAGSVIDGAQLQELIRDSNTMSGKLRGGMG